MKKIKLNTWNTWSCIIMMLVNITTATLFTIIVGYLMPQIIWMPIVLGIFLILGNIFRYYINTEDKIGEFQITIRNINEPTSSISTLYRYVYEPIEHTWSAYEGDKCLLTILDVPEQEIRNVMLTYVMWMKGVILNFSYKGTDISSIQYIRFKDFNNICDEFINNKTNNE